MAELYYLSVESSDVAIRAGVNGVPIVEDDVGGGILTEEPVNVWLKPQDNRLNVEIRTSEEYPDPLAGTATVTVYLHDAESDVPSPATVMGRFAWPPEEWPPEGMEGDVTFPLVFDHALEPQPSAVPDLSVWSDAVVLDGVTDPDRAAIIDLVEEVRSAVLAKDAAGVFTRLAYRYAEEARAEEKEMDSVRDVVLETYEWMFGMPGDLRGASLTEDVAELDVVADGQIVKVGRSDEEDSLVFENDEAEMAFGIPVFVAKIADVWTVVR